jgi:two-component system, response regulator
MMTTASQAGAASPGIATRAMLILVVEDDADDEEAIVGAIPADVPSRLLVARDGAEALLTLQGSAPCGGSEQGTPNLVILDNKMPKIDGLEVLRRMRADPSLQHIPVVILTAGRDLESQEQARSLGANAYVLKPGSTAELRERVGALIRFWSHNEPPPIPR